MAFNFFLTLRWLSAKFDPLVCTTVTTTRKIFSVLLSIFINGHAMGAAGWFGIVMASAGILAEVRRRQCL